MICMMKKVKNIAIKKGAEADIYRAGGAIIKERARKSYRIPQLDEKLRKERTRAEAKLLERAATVINVPEVISREDFSITMSYIEGKRLKDVISSDNYWLLCKKIGMMTALLHNANIIHGDLTTSNMVLSGSQVYFIDFGLGFFSHAIEDMAVDLRLLEEALTSTHPEIAADAMAVVLEEYEKSGGKKEVIERLQKIRTRPRYAKK